MPGPNEFDDKTDKEVIIHTQESSETKVSAEILVQPSVDPSESSGSSIWSYTTSSVYAAVASVGDAGNYVASSTYGAGAYVSSSVSEVSSSIAYYAIPDSELRSAGSDAAYYTALRSSIPVAASLSAAFVGLSVAPALPIVVGAAGLSLGMVHLAGNIGSRTYQLAFGAQDVTAEITIITQTYERISRIQESVVALNESLGSIANALPASFLDSIDLSGLGILTTLVGLKKDLHIKARDAFSANNQSVDLISLARAGYLMRQNIEILQREYAYLSQEQASIQNAIQHIQSAAVAGPAGQAFQAWWSQPGIDWQQIPAMILALGAQVEQLELVVQYQRVNRAIQPYSQAYLRAMASPENLESVSNSMVNAVINTLILSGAQQSGEQAQNQVEHFADNFINMMCTGYFVNGVLEAGGVPANAAAAVKPYNKKMNAKIQSLLAQLSQKLNISQCGLTQAAGVGAQAAILLSAGPAALAGAGAMLATPDIARFLAHNATRNELVALFRSDGAQQMQSQVRDLLVQIMQCVLIAQEQDLLNADMDDPILVANDAEFLQECEQAGLQMGASLRVEIPNYLNQAAAQALGQPNLDITTQIVEPGYFAALQARVREGISGAVHSVARRIQGAPPVEQESKNVPPRLKR